MSDLTLDAAPSPSAEPSVEQPVGRQVIAYLAVADARAAIAWYGDIFGAVLAGEPIVMDDGRIGHAELELGGGWLYLADEFPDIGVTAPAPGAASVSLVLVVPAVDDVVAEAAAAGAAVTREVREAHGTRNAAVVDPFGHRWLLETPITAGSRPAIPAMRSGDIAYASLWVPDGDRAAAFFAEVLGWRYDEGGFHVAGNRLSTGIWGSDEPGTTMLCVAVDDLEAAARRVVAAGGRAGEPMRREEGQRVVDCHDDVGMPFALYERRPGDRHAASADDERVGHGEIGYLTIEAVDSVKAHAFFSTVFGWHGFEPGRVPDGWQVPGVAPMVGLHGGHERPAVVAMFAVDDIETAVGHVRRLGGTAGDVTAEPYGLSALCADDQGTRFYLWQQP